MFLRMVTPLDAEPAVWMDLMIHYKWRKAIILVADDHNGNSVYEAAINQATQKNIQVWQPIGLRAFLKREAQIDQKLCQPISINF